MKVLMRVEQEQKVTEDARLFAEQEAANQRQAVNALQVLSHLWCLCILIQILLSLLNF